MGLKKRMQGGKSEKEQEGLGLEPEAEDSILKSHGYGGKPGRSGVGGKLAVGTRTTGEMRRAAERGGQPIGRKEVEEAIGKLKSGKTPLVGGVMAVLVKHA